MNAGLHVSILFSNVWKHKIAFDSGLVNISEQTWMDEEPVMVGLYAIVWYRGADSGFNPLPTNWKSGRYLTIRQRYSIKYKSIHFFIKFGEYSWYNNQD